MWSLADIRLAESLPYVWLVAFALAATLALLGVACQVLRLGRMKRASWAIWTTLSWLLAALCFTAFCERLDGWLTGWAALITKASLIALVPLVCHRLMTPRAAKTSAAHAGSRLSWGLIAANAFAAVWASGSFYQSVAPLETLLSVPPQISIEWVKLDGAKAYTDSGSSVDLRRLESPCDAGSQPADVTEAFPHRLIQVAASDDRANCHGWVFTGGRFAISGNDVDTILVDNQYDLVEHPQPGDLIVYRGQRREILHSGIVRTAEQGLVLVESKWGALARYLHQPRDQVYSTQYEFYRSPRAGHLIRWEDEAVANSGHASDAQPGYVVLKSTASTDTKQPPGLPTLGRSKSLFVGDKTGPWWFTPAPVASHDVPPVASHDLRHRS